ncbi:MAG: ABC transporter ATP-binding protein, partial [Chloroflexi bacterium]|nr:ABC transporter ATP-binding protein [Chloroflexota bacterium]
AGSPQVQCEGVTKRFGDVLAVDGVSFALEQGRILSILGPSGCGKTTLLRLIAGFESVDAGEIRIRGSLASSPTSHAPPERRNVGMVFQEYALFPHMTVAQNVAFGLGRLSRHERAQRVSEVLELVRLNGLDGRYPHELSGGQQQRVALARTLAPGPVAVLLDEPFSNLDAGMRSAMRQEVEAILRAGGVATIFVTHDREEAFAMADMVGVMANGRLEQLDAPDAIYHRPATPSVARLVGTCDFLRGVIRGGVAVTELGKLPCAFVNGKAADGLQVELLVHPDDFRVEAGEGGACAIKSWEFRGDETILVVELPSGATLRCRHRSHSRLRAGQRVNLIPDTGVVFVAFERQNP